MQTGRAWFLSLALAGAQFGGGTALAQSGPVGRILTPENSPEMAQVQDAFDRCGKETGSLPERIASCTIALNSAGLRPELRAPVLVQRGNAYDDNHQSGLALADYDEAIRLSPDYRFAWHNRGITKLGQNDLSGAIFDLTRATQLDPSKPNTWIGLARAQAMAKQYSGAAVSFERAAALDTSDASLLNSACWARALGREGLPQALADCNASLAIASNPNTYDSRGLVKLLMGDNQGALSDYDTAVRSDASLAGALYGRGVARLRLGQTAAGQADINAALQRDTSLAGKYAERGAPVPTVAAVVRPAPVPAPAPRPVAPAPAGGPDIIYVDSMLSCMKLVTKPRTIQPGTTGPDFEWDVTNGCPVEIDYGYIGKVPGQTGRGFAEMKVLKPGEVEHARSNPIGREGLLVGLTFACPSSKALQPRYRRKIAWAGGEEVGGTGAYRCKVRFEPEGINTAR